MLRRLCRVHFLDAPSFQVKKKTLMHIQVGRFLRGAMQ